MANERGFTLLEVMVALVILGLALSALYQSLGIGMRSAARVDRQQQDIDLAETLFSELGHDRPLRGGVTDGDVRLGQHWRLAIAPIESDADSNKKLALEAFSVALTISWPRQPLTSTWTVQTIMLGAPE